MNIIAASFFALAASAAEPAAQAKAPPPAAMYAAKCASCHGADGKGNPKMANLPMFKGAKLDLRDEETGKRKDEELSKLIADGKRKMPAFKAKLKEAEIADLVAYIRSLAAPKTAQ